jgi:hypothetical protein
MEPYSPQDGARVKADGVIVKPFEASDLIAAVDRLAQKVKEAASAPQHEPTAKIPPLKEPERTMQLDSTQISAMLKEGAQAVSAPQSSAAVPVQEFHVSLPANTVEPPPHSTPAFTGELPSGHDSKPAAVPSYLAQYLTEHAPPKAQGLPEPPPTAEIPKYSELDETFAMHPTLHAPKKPSWARNAAETDASSFRAPFSNESMLQHFQQEAAAEPPVASAEGLELTAAAPVLDVPVEQVPGFESTSQAADATTFVKDPAFESDPHHATTDFPTHFGIAEPVAPEASTMHESAPAQVDEFESRLNAAMSAYEDSPAEIVPEPESSAALQATPTDSAESFVARVEAAMHGFDPPADSPLPELLADPSPIISEIRAELDPLPLPSTSEHISPEVEFSSFSSLDQFHSVEADPIAELSRAPELDPLFSPAVSEHADHEALKIEAISKSTIAPSELEHHGLHEPDEAVIQQMREALAHFPADSSHEPERTEPMALAAAAAASAPAPMLPSPVPATHDGELETTRGIASVIELRSPTAPVSTAYQVEGPSPADANKLAVAVERVMKRELPNLIWKIMAELDLNKRS